MPQSCLFQYSVINKKLCLCAIETLICHTEIDVTWFYFPWFCAKFFNIRHDFQNTVLNSLWHYFRQMSQKCVQAEDIVALKFYGHTRTRDDLDAVHQYVLVLFLIDLSEFKDSPVQPKFSESEVLIRSYLRIFGSIFFNTSLRSLIFPP